MTEPIKSLGQIAYEAYLDFCGGNSLVTGQPLPEWPEAISVIQHAWEHAAQEVRLEALARAKPSPSQIVTG